MQNHLPPWEKLLKQMLWQQLGDLQGCRILDFGSGTGITASHYADRNAVVAIEPSEEAVKDRCREHPYEQLTGSTEQLNRLPDESFDVIFCHNVLEYAEDREAIVREFARLLKPGGLLSVVKHNRPGRVMQMAVLLNDFDKANALLDGHDGAASRYGTIRYYEDADVERWSEVLQIVETLGMRTFWDLQQNQEIQKDEEWQARMLQLEMRVSNKEEYKAVAFFHHLIIRKKETRL